MEGGVISASKKNARKCSFKKETHWNSRLNTGIKIDVVRIHFCSAFYLPIKLFFIL